jgi:hypothetical protein
MLNLLSMTNKSIAVVGHIKQPGLCHQCVTFQAAAESEVCAVKAHIAYMRHAGDNGALSYACGPGRKATQARRLFWP